MISMTRHMSCSSNDDSSISSSSSGASWGLGRSARAGRWGAQWTHGSWTCRRTTRSGVWAGIECGSFPAQCWQWTDGRSKTSSDSTDLPKKEGHRHTFCTCSEKISRERNIETSKTEHPEQTAHGRCFWSTYWIESKTSTFTAASLISQLRVKTDCCFFRAALTPRTRLRGGAAPLALWRNSANSHLCSAGSPWNVCPRAEGTLQTLTDSLKTWQPPNCTPG